MNYDLNRFETGLAGRGRMQPGRQAFFQIVKGFLMSEFHSPSSLAFTPLQGGKKSDT
jgi:hypothetical protein